MHYVQQPEKCICGIQNCVKYALTHVALDQPLPFLYEIPCEGK